MNPYPPLRIKTVVERHAAKLPCFVTVPLSTVARWGLSDTTTIEGSINGAPLGRRSIKHWVKRKCWWIDVPAAVCRKARIDVGDRVDMELRVADTSLPDELVAVSRQQPKAERAWQRLTRSQQRMLREDITVARRRQTRQKRAQRLLRSR